MHAQEAKYIDLAFVQQTELRHPPDCEAGKCIGGSVGGGSIADGAPDQRDPHALGVYVLQVTPTEIHRAEPFEAEFDSLNTGREVDLDVRCDAL